MEDVESSDFVKMHFSFPDISVNNEKLEAMENG